MTGADSRQMQAAYSVRSTRLLLVLILLVSTLIQLTVVSRTVVNAPLRSDALNYFSHAYNLRHFGVYSGDTAWKSRTDEAPPSPDAIVTPGYPLFLLAIGGLEPSSAYLRRVSIAQATLGVLSVWLIYLISAKFLGPRLALIPALLTAASPHLSVMSTYVLTETLFVFMLLLSMLVSIIALSSRSRSHMAAAGILWGFCSLVRPTMQFLPFLGLLLVLVVPRFREFRAGTVLGVICFIAVQVPWHTRTLSLPNNPAEPSLMVNFLNFGSYPEFMYDNLPESYGSPYRFDPRIDEVRKDLSSALADISSRAANQPGKYLAWYLIGKPKYFLSWDNIDGAGDIYVYPAMRSPYLDSPIFKLIKALTRSIHWPLMILGLAGIATLGLRRVRLEMRSEQLAAITFVTAVFLYALAIHVVGAPLPRYGIPFKLLLYPMAVFATAHFYRSFIAPNLDQGSHI